MPVPVNFMFAADLIMVMLSLGITDRSVLPLQLQLTQQQEPLGHRGTQWLSGRTEQVIKSS
jgi:hypothetical protein